jgi:SAM-dependent methyltransferase
MTHSLLLGCGNDRRKLLSRNDPTWDQLTTLDMDPLCGPDVLWDLNARPLPFADNTFDEIHAYEVLEHVGRQGDWRGFFEEFSDYWRALRPGGMLAGSTPAMGSPWLWGDPGHTRALSLETMTFLVQPQYDGQLGLTAMTDYRHVYKADFDLEHSTVEDGKWWFAFRAVKPSRCKVGS